MGPLFVSNEAALLSEVFKDCDYKTPMIFVLSAGSDPLAGIQKFAKENNQKLMAISLGQGKIFVLNFKVKEKSRNEQY